MGNLDRDNQDNQGRFTNKGNPDNNPDNNLDNMDSKLPLT